MDKNTLKIYRQARRDGMSTPSALRYAREAIKPMRPELVVFKEWGRTEWNAEGFIVKARIVDDQSGDYSYLGRFSARNDEGAIKRHNASPREFGYFVPAYSFEERYRDLRALNYSRRDSYEMAQKQTHEDMKRAESLGDDWSFVGVEVRAYKRGIELGSSSLWGIESDSDQRYFADVAQECADIALDEAISALKSLCEPVEMSIHI
jgi:hypothetical protein